MEMMSLCILTAQLTVAYHNDSSDVTEGYNRIQSTGKRDISVFHHIQMEDSDASFPLLVPSRSTTTSYTHWWFIIVNPSRLFVESSHDEEHISRSFLLHGKSRSAVTEAVYQKGLPWWPSRKRLAFTILVQSRNDLTRLHITETSRVEETRDSKILCSCPLDTTTARSEKQTCRN